MVRSPGAVATWVEPHAGGVQAPVARDPTRRALLAIAAAGVAARLLAAALSPPPQAWEYDALARSVLRGEGLVYVHHGAPYRSYYAGVPYVAWTAGLYAAFPDGLRAVQVAQCLLSAVSVAATFAVGRRVVGPRAALLGALLVAAHPGLAYYDVRNAHPLGFDTAAGLLALLALMRTLESPGVARAAAAGLALGVAALQRGSLLPFALVALAVLLRRAGRVPALAAAAAVTLVVGAWVARNLAVHGRPLLLTTTGEHLWIGNTAGSVGASLLPSGVPVLATVPDELARRLAHADELGRDRLFREALGAEVAADPGAAVRRLALKAVRFWTWSPATGVTYPRWAFATYATYYVAAVALAGVGVAAGLRGGRPASLLLAAFVGSVFAVHTAVYLELRHRWAIEPVLLLLSGAGLDRMLPARWGRSLRTPP